LSISENIGNKVKRITIILNIGRIYISLNPDKAVSYFLEVIDLADELNLP